MTPEQFWYDEPRLLEVYIKKQELERDNMNYNAWLIGLYVDKALASTLGGMFGKKGSKVEPYFAKPIEELNSNYIRLQNDEEQKKDDIKTNYNKWAKLGKKGGK